LSRIKQGVAEEVNPEVTSDKYTEPSQNVRMGDFVFNARTFTGGLVAPNAKGLQIRAYDPKNLKSSIGSADFIVKTNKKGKQWLESDDTEVNDEYRGQGVATMMYTFAKSLGNDIKPSDYQSNAGGTMWKKWGSDAKHLGEQGVAEGESNDTAISLSKLGKFHPGADTLAEFVPERASARYALHPDKWESTFYSLTNKDSDKLKYYGPKKISIPPGTLVGDMAIANKFYRAKTPEEQEQYAELYKASLKPYPVDVSEYRMPELLIPKHGVAEQQLDELSFLGSECTKDCSGHRAGYEWSKRKGLRQANSLYSPSFNKGSALAVAGK